MGATDGSFVYWSFPASTTRCAPNQPDCSLHDAAFQRAPINGGTVTTIANEDLWRIALVPGGAVYWRSTDIMQIDLPR